MEVPFYARWKIHLFNGDASKALAKLSIIFTHPKFESLANTYGMLTEAHFVSSYQVIKALEYFNIFLISQLLSVENLLLGRNFFISSTISSFSL